MTKKRLFSIFSLLLALVMCFSVFTACELDDDGKRGGSSNSKTSSSSSIKTYVYNYSDISKLEEYDSPAELDSSKWKSSASFDLAKQWVFKASQINSAFGFGANVIKVENTSSSAMEVDLYFKVSGDISESGDKVIFSTTIFNESGDPAYSYEDSYRSTSLSNHTSKSSPFASFTVPANGVRFVIVMQTFGSNYPSDDEALTEAAVEFNAKVTLGVSAKKASNYTEDVTQTEPSHGGYETVYETDYNDNLFGDLSYEDALLEAVIIKGCYEAPFYDGYGNILFTLNAGDMLTITGINYDYDIAKVEYKSKIGYVELPYLELYGYSDDTEYETVYETMTPADSDFAACEMYGYVYREATLYDENMNYCGYIPMGTTVTVYGVSFDYVWCKVYYHGGYYFIYRDYVEFTEEEESESYDVSLPEYYEYEGRDEYVTVPSYYDSIPLYDAMLNPIIEVSGGTELLLTGVSTDPDRTWSAVMYNDELFYVYSYLLEH